MAAYTDTQLLTLWESALGQHPVDRALTLLMAAEPGETRAGLAALAVGELDERLLRVYQAAFGGRLECLASCPACGAQLEFELAAEALESHAPLAGQSLLTLRHGDYSVQYRLPNSLDLAAAAQAADPGLAREELIAGCILEAGQDGHPLGANELPGEVIQVLENKMAESDHLLDLVCANCGSAWQEPLDMSAFLWARVTARARRLLIEVHNLAGAYGWSEAEILAMSPARRAAYAELIG